MTCIWWQLDVIGIDEAQFFEDLYDFCREAADHDGERVIVAGLDGNYLRYLNRPPIIFSYFYARDFFSIFFYLIIIYHLSDNGF